MKCANVSGGFNLVNWDQGLTQGGSSGSGMFVEGRLAGVLYGGDAQTCPASGGMSIYGRFDLLFPNVQKWLAADRSEEHTSELQSPCNLVCRLLLEKKKKNQSPLRVPTYSTLHSSAVPFHHHQTDSAT